MSNAGERVQFGSPEFTEAEYIRTNLPCPTHGEIKPGGCCDYFASDHAYIFTGSSESISIRYREVRQYVSEDGFSARIPYEAQIHIPFADLPSITNALRIFMQVNGIESTETEEGLLFLKPKEDDSNE